MTYDAQALTLRICTSGKGILQDGIPGAKKQSPPEPPSFRQVLRVAMRTHQHHTGLSH